MNLRNLVPALALTAFTAVPAMAADAAPAVTFSGWVDTVLQFSDDSTEDVSATAPTNPTAKDESGGSLRFTGAASLKANWKVTDAVSAKINLWFDPGSANVNMREAYFTWAINDTLAWSMGKYIDHLGWISAEPTGPTYLFINADTIGYRQVYGNDVLGTALNIAPKDSPVSGAIHITNGYFTGSDATSTNYVSANSGTRENTDLGFGLDLTFKLPDGMGDINAELAYDIGSGDTSYLGGPTPAANGLGGDVLMAGINATVKPVKILTLGAELQYLTVGESESVTGVSANNGIDRLQFLLLGNVAIEGASIPMSATLLVQYITIDRDGTPTPETEDRLYVGAALLTNPLNSSNFGLNFEVGYFDKSGVNGVAGSAGEVDGLTVAVEGLVSF